MRSIDDVDDDYDWDEVYRRLLAYSVTRLGGRSRLPDAEQITQEALTQLFDHKYYDWDPDAGVPLLQDLGSRVNGLVSNLRRKEKRRGPHVEFEERTHGATPSPESQTIGQEDGRRAIGDLLSRLDGDEVSSEMVLLMVDGCDKPADIAAKMGRDVREIYNARRRLVPHIAAVAAVLGRSSS